MTLAAQGVLKFGTIKTVASQPLGPAIMAAVVLGASAGVLGSIFVGTVRMTDRLRKQYVTSNWRKVLEVSIFAFLTAASFFVLIRSFSKCVPLPP